jgi:hypothetical protein
VLPTDDVGGQGWHTGRSYGWSGAHQFLYLTQVDSSHDETTGERVPKAMPGKRRNTRHLYSCSNHCIGFDNFIPMRESTANCE